MTIAVRPWLFGAFLATIIAAALSRIVLQVVEDRSPVSTFRFLPSPQPSETPPPSVPPLVLTLVAIPSMRPAPAAPNEARALQEQAQLVFGSRARIFVYDPDVEIGSGAEDPNGMEYVQFMPAMPESAVWGPGRPEPSQLGVLTAGVVRSINSDFTPEGSKAGPFDTPFANPLIFGFGSPYYFLGGRGVRVLSNPAAAIARSTPTQPHCEPGRHSTEDALLEVEPNGTTRRVVTFAMLRAAGISQQSGALTCSRFESDWLVGFQHDKWGYDRSWFVIRGNSLMSIWRGRLIEAGPHRLLLVKDEISNNHQRYLEGLAP